MKVLAISQVYYPDTASTAQHLTDLLEKLVENGHEVTVITSSRKYENPKEKFSKREVVNGVNVVRITNTGFGKKNKISRLIDFISFNLLISVKLLFLKKERFDSIIGMTSPPLLSYVGILFAKLKKMKFIYWTMDLQPELSVVAGYLKTDSYAARSLQRKGDFIFSKSDKIIALDVYMKEHIEKRLNKKLLNVDIIPVWPVMQDIYEGNREDNSFRIQNEFGNKIVIMYSGNHSVMHPLDVLLESAYLLRNDDRFLFVHIGGGDRLKNVIDFKIKNNLDNIITLPYQPREFIHISLGSSDIQVVSLGQECVGYTHPNKIYGSMYIGKPILYIGPNKSHITDILKDCPGNICVDHDDKEKLHEALLKFAQLSEEEKELIGKNNRLYASKYFSPEFLKKQMVDSVQSV